MASSRVPARTAPKPVKKTTVPFEAVTEIDEEGNYEALVFGEKFKLSSDVNGWLLFLAGAGRPRDIINLVESVLVVEVEDGEDIEAARRRIRDRFHGHVGSLPHFSIEQAIELLNAMTEVSAGNES